MMSLALAFVTQEFMVPMRDGTRLHTLVHFPTDTSDFPLPVILVRTPYSNYAEFDPGTITYLTDVRRYILVVQNTRGTGLSEGVDSVFLDDGWRGDKRDGWDAVDWITRQPWCDGRVGTWGGSARGITQYLLAGAAHPAHICGVPVVAAWDLYSHAVMPGGEYRQADIDAWLTGQGALYMKEYYYEHYNKDTAWQWVDVGTRVDSITVALWHIGGWYDIFSEGTIEAFQSLKHLGNQKLLMGPWVHGGVNFSQAGEITYPNAVLDSLNFWILEWYDYWLKGQGDISRIPTVYYYLMGPVDTSGYWNDWFGAEDWPPSPDSVVLYLREGGILSFDPPGAELPDAFAYDPHFPVPTVGGNNLTLPAGPFDQDSVWDRPDVLTYVSEPLTADVVVRGPVKARLYISSNCLDTDFTAKLVDVYPDGRKMLVLDGIKMARHRLGLDREDLLTPGEIYELTVELGNTAYVFPAGHRIGLAVSSSNFPRFKLNLNNGGHPFRDTTDTLVALNTVFHDAAHPSALILTGELYSSTAESGAKSRLSLAPNPFAGWTTLSGYRGPASLYDAAGRLVERFEVRGQARIGQGLRPGVYYLKVRGKTLKLVKRR